MLTLHMPHSHAIQPTNLMGTLAQQQLGRIGCVNKSQISCRSVLQIFTEEQHVASEACAPFGFQYKEN